MVCLGGRVAVFFFKTKISLKIPYNSSMETPVDVNYYFFFNRKFPPLPSYSPVVYFSGGKGNGFPLPKTKKKSSCFTQLYNPVYPMVTRYWRKF